LWAKAQALYQWYLPTFISWQEISNKPMKIFPTDGERIYGDGKPRNAVLQQTNISDISTPLVDEKMNVNVSNDHL
jgi:hypothetical protein